MSRSSRVLELRGGTAPVLLQGVLVSFNGAAHRDAIQREAGMAAIRTVLLIVAAACFLLEAVGVQTRVNLVAMGLFFATLSLLVG